MQTLRRIDWYVQISIIGLSVLFIPFLYFFAPLLGLLFLGIIQMISALLNTASFMHSGFKKNILTYWIYFSFDIVLAITGWLRYFESSFSNTLIIVSLIGGFILSTYYLVVYKKLIENLYIKDELSGFTKS